VTAGSLWVLFESTSVGRAKEIIDHVSFPLLAAGATALLATSPFSALRWRLGCLKRLPFGPDRRRRTCRRSPAWEMVDIRPLQQWSDPVWDRHRIEPSGIGFRVSLLIGHGRQTMGLQYRRRRGRRVETCRWRRHGVRAWDVERDGMGRRRGAAATRRVGGGRHLRIPTRRERQRDSKSKANAEPRRKTRPPPPITGAAYLTLISVSLSWLFR